MSSGTKGRTVYKMGFAPLVLKELILDCDISQTDLAKATGASRPSVNGCVNRGYFPEKFPNFRMDIETYLRTFNRAHEVADWLGKRGIDIGGIWQPLGKELRKKSPRGSGARANERRYHDPAMVPGNPDAIEEEKQMRKIRIPAEVLKHFKIFRDPFQNDPSSDKEVFRSEEHRYIEHAMLDAAQNSGFLAVIAEVGAGKSVMRRAVIDKMRQDQRVRVVYPRIIDKTRVTAGSLCDAIVHDLSGDDGVKVKTKLEDKARQVEKLLIARVSQATRVCLILEEAHDLTTPALKYLKRFNEMELGFTKLLGIILLGQSELANKLDEEQNPDMREVIRRVQVAQMTGLDENLWEYLKLKFSLVGGDVAKVMEPEAAVALASRLTIPGGRNGKRVSVAYPLTVNNYVANAMVLAVELGQEMITADVVNQL